MPRRRRLVPVSEDIVEQLAALARRSGLTIPELADTILGQAVRVLRSRDDVAGVLADAVVLADIARLGGSPVPLEALGRLLEAVGEDAYRGFVDEAAGLARLVAVSARARGVDPLHGLSVVVRTFYPGAAVDLVEEGDGWHRLVVASPLLRGRLLGLVERSLVSVVEGFGGEIAEKEAEEGLVALRFRVRQQRLLPFLRRRGGAGGSGG